MIEKKRNVKICTLLDNIGHKGYVQLHNQLNGQVFNKVSPVEACPKKFQKKGIFKILLLNYNFHLVN